MIYLNDRCTNQYCCLLADTNITILKQIDGAFMKHRSWNSEILFFFFSILFDRE